LPLPTKVMPPNLNNINAQINHIDIAYNDQNNDIISQYYTADSFNSLNSINETDLRIISLNIRSLIGHHDELIALLSNLKHRFNIICLEESWLKESETNMYTIEGYKSHHSLRPIINDKRPGGGVSVYVSDELQAECIPDTKLSLPFIESIFLKISLNNSKHIIIGTIYRPPSGDTNRFIDELCRMINSLNTRQDCILTGDFNIDLLKLNNNEYPIANELINAMNTYSLRHVITKPTRVTTNSSTLIDNIFTSNPINIISGILDVSISDHFPIFIIQKNMLPKRNNTITPTTISYRLINDRTLYDLGNCLNDYDFDAVYSCTDSTEAINQLNAVLDEKFNYYCPVKTKIISNKVIHKPWITPHILRCIKRRDNLYRLLRNGRTTIDVCKRYRNYVTKEIRTRKRQYYADLFERHSNDTKKTWSVINSLLRPSNNKKDSSIREIVCNNNTYTDKSEIADQMNSYFCNIGRNITDSIPDNGKTPNSYITTNLPNSFFFSPISTNTTKNIIMTIKNKAGKLAEIPVKVIKYLSPIISPIICYIINLSLSTGQFPDSLKVARVTPIHKAADKSDMSNYRPISVLPTLSKIFERIAYNQLYSYLEYHNILTRCQYGFRIKKSTTLALLNQLQYLYSKLDSDEYVLSLFLDFRKAFDCVRHDILIEKLEKYGIRGIALDWFTSYLSDRKQYIIIDGHKSPQQNITHGVPQGSILGPLLFLIFINDLPIVTPYFKYILFADDSTLSTSFKKRDAKDVAITINQELSKIHEWLLTNKISVNTDKTKYIIFSYRNSPTTAPIFLGNSQISETSDIKFLGVTLDKQLTFKNHVDNISSKLSRSVGILYKLSHYLPHKTLKLLYHTMVHPLMTYGIEAWYATYDNVRERIFLIQKRAIRAVNNLSFRAHTTEYFNRNSILMIEDFYIYQILLFIYKFKNSLINDTSFTFTYQNETHGHRTRRRYDICIPQFNKAKSQRSITYEGAKQWNSLADDVKNLGSLNSFSKCIKSIMLSKYLDVAINPS